MKVPMKASLPSITVIIVTYNPRQDLLAWALDSLGQQTLAKDQFEVIVVDNNSNPPLELRQLLHGRALNLRLVQEEQQGIMFARRLGILEAAAELLVFVDDDNHLAPDYLEVSLNIARLHPEIGAFGGRARGVFETPPTAWQLELVNNLGIRDFGDEAITSTDQCWGPWEPIGAGMVVRRDVAVAFVDRMQKQPETSALGRAGKLLSSGDDALLARTAYLLGYSCSYQPSLELEHYMKRARLTFNTLCRTIEGHGRAEVLLLALQGQKDHRPRMPRSMPLLVASFLYRVFRNGLRIGYIQWHWDFGYYRQTREMIKRLKNGPFSQ